MRETAKELDWHLNYASIARIWRGGCIIKVRIDYTPFSYPVYPSIASMQSVFLGDITSAYEKNPNLESLLFDGFFNKGARLWPPTLVNLCIELGSQPSTKHSPAGDGLLLRVPSGVSPSLRSAQHLPSSTATAATFSQPISYRRSAITLVLTPSVSSQGRRMRGSSPARIFVSVPFQLRIITHLIDRL